MSISFPLKGFLATAIVFAAPAAAFAFPGGGAVEATSSAVHPSVELVAMGCGFGRTRDALGRCRHRFNLFDRHDRRRFHQYRSNHCTAVETPNGHVRRCRI